MYFRGRVLIDLSGATVVLRQPANFFGGLANLLTQGSWQTKEEMETHKLLAFSQCANRALRALGVKNAVRVSIGKDVIYEDFRQTDDDFDAALETLQDMLSRGHEPDPSSEFDLVLKHDDGVLNYVIDLDFVREHRTGIHPVAITVTAVPSELRRGDGEDDRSYRQRVKSHLRDQQSFDEAQERWEAHFDGFLDQIADHFRTNIGVVGARVETQSVLLRRRDADALNTYTSFGYPLYSYGPATDLAYLGMWDSLWEEHNLRVRNAHYGDPGGPYASTGDSGWSYGDVRHYEQSHPVPAQSDDGGGGQLVTAEAPSDSGGGGALTHAPAASDSGGGGWLSSIGDFFSGGASGSGGGGDVGGGDSGGGGDGGGGCGGGGCGGG